MIKPTPNRITPNDLGIYPLSLPRHAREGGHLRLSLNPVATQPNPPYRPETQAAFFGFYGHV